MLGRVRTCARAHVYMCSGVCVRVLGNVRTCARACAYVCSGACVRVLGRGRTCARACAYMCSGAYRCNLVDHIQMQPCGAHTDTNLYGPDKALISGRCLESVWKFVGRFSEAGPQNSLLYLVYLH